MHHDLTAIHVCSGGGGISTEASPFKKKDMCDDILFEKIFPKKELLHFLCFKMSLKINFS